MREWKNDQAALKERFDLDADGKIDQTEWRLARSQARRDVTKARREQGKAFVEGINLLTKTNDRRRPFLLSAFSQKDLAKRYRQWALLYLTGVFAIGSVGLWLFNTRFG